MKSFRTVTNLVITAALLVAAAFTLPAAAQVSQPYAASYGSNLSRVAGKFVASNYSAWQAKVEIGNSSTGSATIILDGGIIALPDGRNIIPFNVGTPLLVDLGTNQETVTPTAVGGCQVYSTAVMQAATCSVTASFSFTHGHGAPVQSGTAGLQEAIGDALVAGGGLSGGVVVIDSQWYRGVAGAIPGTAAMITTATPYPLVAIEDTSVSPAQYWNSQPSTTSFLAAPAVLTATTVGFALNGAAATGGTYTGTSTYFACVAYVDINGNESACSTTFSGLTAGTGATNQIGFSAPAASTGAVGYTVYLSLASGSYALAYQVPLTGTVCTLTKVETVTPACAVTNTTYSQTGSSAVVSTLTVNTSPLALQLAGVGNQLGTGVVNAHTSYAYASGTANGPISNSLPFTTTAGPWATATPVPMGTIAIPAGILNQVGKTIRVCGKYTVTPSASATIENLQIYFDGAGSDAAGSPVQIANIQGTATYTAVVYNGSFCETFTTTVSGAGVTAGSIIGGANVSSVGIASAPTNLVTALDTKNAATASLNLAGGSGFTTRLHIVQNHTTGSDTEAQLLNVTVEVL